MNRSFLIMAFAGIVGCSAKVAPADPGTDPSSLDGCVPTVAADGVQRCLPGDAALVSSFFADAECHEPLIVTLVRRARPEYAYSYETTSSGGAALYYVGAHYDGDFFELRDGAQCYAAGTTSGVPAITFYRVGDEVPPSSFPEAR